MTLLLNAAYLHLRRSEYSAASELLDRARRLAPDSPDVAKLDGWADYGLNRLPQAVEEWKRAQQLRPDPEVASALERAERDAQVETNFEEGVSAHFLLRYDGSAAPDLARAVLNDLESDFDSMASLFDYTPAEPIAVILYTNQDFADITRAPAWVGALNDGRIRVPVQGLLTVTPALASDLRHELAHSFISQKTRGNCAIWLHEGIAQWAEGKRSGSDAAMLVDLYDSHDDPSLASLEKSWMALPADYVARCLCLVSGDRRSHRRSGHYRRRRSLARRARSRLLDGGGGAVRPAHGLQRSEPLHGGLPPPHLPALVLRFRAHRCSRGGETDLQRRQ